MRVEILDRVRLLGLRLLCARVERNMSAGGIALPEGREGTANLLRVLKQGDGIEAPTYQKREFRINVGEYITVDPRMLQLTRVEGETLCVIDEDAAVLVFSGEDLPCE